MSFELDGMPQVPPDWTCLEPECSGVLPAACVAAARGTGTIGFAKLAGLHTMIVRCPECGGELHPAPYARVELTSL